MNQNKQEKLYPQQKRFQTIKNCVEYIIQKMIVSKYSNQYKQKLMCNQTLAKILFLFFIILCVQTQQQKVQQISQCIGNCMNCDPKKPSICLDESNKLVSDKVCIPFYKGSNCQQQTYGYENIFKQNGTFTGWSINRTASCQVVSKDDKGVLVSLQNMNYSGLGSFKNDETLNKSMMFGNGTITNRAVIKFSVAVDDPNLQSYFSQQSQSSSTNESSTSTATDPNQNQNIITQNRTQTLPNGTVLTYTISYYDLKSTNTTTTSQSQSVVQTKASKEWMTVQLVDATNNQTVSNRTLSFNTVSSVRTTCGFIYTYQLTFDLNKQYTELSLKFSVTANLTLSWTLLNFDFSLGCRAFLVSSANPQSYNCDQCLSGYYPKYAINNQVEQCKPCDYRCKTCFNSTSCITCTENTVLNKTTGMCQFSQYFKTMGNFQIVTGKSFDVGTLFGSQVVKSQGGKIQLSQPLQNTQAFKVYLTLLYSEGFRNSGQYLQIFINNQKYRLNTSDLSLDASTKINGLSTITSNIYKTALSYNVSKIVPVNLPIIQNVEYIDAPRLSASNQKASIKLQTRSNPDQFGVTNVKVVQFRCSKNCQQCQYSEFTQTSQCTKCAYFFDLSANCLTCANGYYPATINALDQCIKCHSTCKQCSGPEITDCLTCFDSFQLGEMMYDYQCITCIYKSQFYNSSSISQCIRSPQCETNHPISKVMTNKNCQLCLKAEEDQLTTSNFCKSCWLAQNLAKSSCEPMPERGFQIYGSDISKGIISSQWTSNKQLVRKNLTSQYTDLYGVNWESSGNQTTIMTFTEPILPSHRGLTIFFTFFKVNTWNGNNDKINVLIRSQDKYTVINNTINVNPSHGFNIYGEQQSGPEMMYTFVGNSMEHSYNGKLQIIITSTHTGLFLRDMEVYLGNCNQCDGNKMTYQVYYIPAYSTNDTQTGLDVWLTFNQGVNFFSSDQDTQNKIVNSFQFSIDQLGYQNLIPFIIKENKLNTWNYVKYFLPIQSTLINATLRVNNTMGNNIYSKLTKLEAFFDNPLVSSQRKNLNIQETMEDKLFLDSKTQPHTPRLLLNQRLSSTNVQERVYRYEDLIIDERKSMAQLDTFYDFFQWFTLITMIVFAFFGIGIIFQEFSILLQILFIHIYVSTQLLPATFKQPLSHLQKIQNLNFFTYPNARSIEQSWFENIQQPSDYPFTQYNIDVYFARSFYPIIIINLIYLFWFIVLLVCFKFIRPFKTSPNKIIKFFRDIPQRPLNYLDQIWRYQFITTMWASFIQFRNFSGDTGQMRLNLALCVISFSISIIWPVFVMVYTYRQHNVINVEHFMYLYNDIFYRKISSLAQKSTYYMYIAVRFGRYFFYALLIAVFLFRNIIAPVILLAITFLEIIYILKFKIYRDKFYLLLKIIENIGFIILQILLLIVYGFAGDTISKQGFVNIGYGINAIYILMIINGLFRVIYLCYKKGTEIFNGRYDYGEKGDLQNYDNKSPAIIELPTTQRGLY